MLPPENATGNFVKVVQRVPVKIVFDDGGDSERMLGLGMSVTPAVRIAGAPTPQPADPALSASTSR
jgi:membrane fusion protein (multidrug efflux system)